MKETLHIKFFESITKFIQTRLETPQKQNLVLTNLHSCSSVYMFA